MFAFIALHLWQSTLIVIAAWVLARACSRNAAAVRYWIWLGASLKFLAPFALLQSLGDHIGRSLPAPPPIDPMLLETGRAIFVPTTPGVVASLAPQVQIVVGAIWAAGAATLLVRWFLEWRAIHSALACAPQVSVDLAVPVRVTSRDLPPGVFGVVRPVVIVPRSVLRELAPEELRAVLAHEMHHVRRRDNLTAALHKCIEVIFWFHPLVWWIGANLLREREAACDESVIEEGCERAVYADSILHICRLGVTAKFSSIAASSGGSLTQRMCSIMSRERAQPIGQGRLSVLLVTAGIACYGPIAAGIVSGAIREASPSGPIRFDVLTLEPSGPAWRRSTHFDLTDRRLSLKNVSLRHLISLAYPASKVRSDPELIDHVHYHIEARWRGERGTSARSVYRALLKEILRSNSNLQLYVNDQCDDSGCDRLPRQLVAGRPTI